MPLHLLQLSHQIKSNAKLCNKQKKYPVKIDPTLHKTRKTPFSSVHSNPQRDLHCVHNHQTIQHLLQLEARSNTSMTKIKNEGDEITRRVYVCAYVTSMTNENTRGNTPRNKAEVISHAESNPRLSSPLGSNVCCSARKRERERESC